jgi:hypothetical protein
MSLENDFFKYIAISIFVEKHKLLISYPSINIVNQLKQLGIDLFNGLLIFEKTIDLIEHSQEIIGDNSNNNFKYLFDSKTFNFNINFNNNLFTCNTSYIYNLINNYLNDPTITSNIIINNKFKDRYNKNNDCFIYISDSFNPNISYYDKILSNMNFNNLYLSIDTNININTNIIKLLIDKYPSIQILNYDIVELIQFASTNKFILLSQDNLSGIIGYLSFYSNIYYPEYKCKLHANIEPLVYWNIGKQFVSINKRGDGFGAQFQHIIFGIIYAELNQLQFLHHKIEDIEHNYNNNPKFIDNINDLMNIHNEYLTISYQDIHKSSLVELREIYYFVEMNLDKSNNLYKIKNCFWSNKNKSNIFNNNKLNIAVHIRRLNSHDNRIEGTNTDYNYYLKVINYIREKYLFENKELLFHIYSQGNIQNFNCFQQNDVVFHLDEDLSKTFIELVGADILITSASSLSYSAALLTDGEVYYLPFWHKPMKNWIIL